MSDQLVATLRVEKISVVPHRFVEPRMHPAPDGSNTEVFVFGYSNGEAVLIEASGRLEDYHGSTEEHNFPVTLHIRTVIGEPAIPLLGDKMVVTISRAD